MSRWREPTPCWCFSCARKATHGPVIIAETFPRCDLCRACNLGSDCLTSTCNASGRCTFRTDVTIPWLDSCHGPSGPAHDVTVPSVPAGTYDVTALDSGGIVWSSVALPGQGWFWYIMCQNLAVPELATPSGVYYATAADAFRALPRTTSRVSYAGGTLTCYFSDSFCGDNSGSTRFRMERVCP